MKNLSVITICLNERNTIAQTLESVINQSCRDFEYIVIDGGSTDGTLEIIKKYESDIDVLVSEPDQGIFNAQNKGIAIAGGSYITLLNSGDYYCNNKIIERIFENNLTADIIYGDIIIKMNSGLKYRKKSPTKPTEMFFMYDCLPHPGTLFNANMFDEIGGLDESFPGTADYEFFLRSLFSKGRSAQYLPFPIAVFNLSGFSSIHEKTEKVQSERKRAQELHLDPRTLKFFTLFRPFHILFQKKFRYLYYLIMSNLSDSFMKIE
jgi:glycosyltransferase involved in cell wall biosynthesis